MMRKDEREKQCNNSIVDIDRWKSISKLYAHQIQSIGDISFDDGVFSDVNVLQRKLQWIFHSRSRIGTSKGDLKRPTYLCNNISKAFPFLAKMKVLTNEKQLVKGSIYIHSFPTVNGPSKSERVKWTSESRGQSCWQNTQIDQKCNWLVNNRKANKQTKSEVNQFRIWWKCALILWLRAIYRCECKRSR